MTITSLNIADGTVGRRRLPTIRKRYVVLGTVLAIVLVVLGLAYHFGFFTKQAVHVVQNPSKALPPSASILHRFEGAAVCADHADCAKIGREVLERNGSAVDAALAALFCNGVLTMQSMGLGGGFLMTIYIKATHSAYVLNAREKAPLNATADLYKPNKLLSQSGPLSIGVPGELRGYWMAHKRFGKLPWKEIIEPTIKACESGYVMSDHQYMSLKFRPKVKDANLRKWFVEENGELRKPGSVIIPRQLCQTLRIIAENGGDDLYNGTLSRLLVEDLREMGSLVTAEDLESYRPEWVEPMSVRLRNQGRLYAPPPPGSGVLVAFILNILDGYKFHPGSIRDVNSTVATFHKTIEAFKFAYAKRTELGDMDFVNITELLANLTSTEYASIIRSKIKPNATSQDPNDYGAVSYTSDDHGTAHISVLAQNGDAVSVTSSVNLYFGSGMTSPQTGIILNSVMDDFSFPYFKNYFNLPSSPNNAVQPGKRPLSSMSPTIVVDELDNVKLVLGAAGGSKITSNLALVIARVLWFGQNIKEAVDAPRLHHQLFPMELRYEYGVLRQVVEGLERIGHKTHRLVLQDGTTVICAIMKTPEGVFANADYRKGGDVFGI